MKPLRLPSKHWYIGMVQFDCQRVSDVSELYFLYQYCMELIQLKNKNAGCFLAVLLTNFVKISEILMQIQFLYKRALFVKFAYKVFLVSKLYCNNTKFFLEF